MDIETAKTLLCAFDCCNPIDEEKMVAAKAMPQSSDQGSTVIWVPTCENHCHGWWDGADWDGSHLEFQLRGNNDGY